MTVSNRTQNSTTPAASRKPVLLELYEVESYTYALRYSCKDTNVWHEIKDIIMSADRDYRRWDPDECNGRGCWVVDATVLDELTTFFPSIPAWLQKSAQPAAASRNIEECPF